MAEALADHASQHGLQSLLVAIFVVPHALEGNSDAHLPTGYGDSGIEQVQVGQLPIDAIIYYVQGFEAPIQGVVQNQDSLERPAFQRKSSHGGRGMFVVVRVDPGLRASLGI